MDEDGYFWFVGRSDDVICRAPTASGRSKSRARCSRIAAVAESAVVGSPDADRGNIVKAFVVLRAGYEPGERWSASCKEHCKRITAPYKYPREIEFVGELPKTRSGKIRRVELRQAELKKKGATPGSGFV